MQNVLQSAPEAVIWVPAWIATTSWWVANVPSTVLNALVYLPAFPSAAPARLIMPMVDWCAQPQLVFDPVDPDE